MPKCSGDSRKGERCGYDRPRDNYDEDMYVPFTREIAEKWTRHMENEDGMKGLR